jgi:hypothetical protein
MAKKTKQVRIDPKRPKRKRRRGKGKSIKEIFIGETMTDLDKGKTMSRQELMVSTLAMVDAVTKLLIEKGVISEEEFREKLMEERATYQKILNPTQQ